LTKDYLRLDDKEKSRSD